MEAIGRPHEDAWLCMGDFNEITWSCEKKGDDQRSFSAMEQFRDVIAKCNLHDLGYKGNTYTWSNGKIGDENVQERLDRGLTNITWKC